MPINQRQATAIMEFMDAVRKLREVGVIRSDNILGDIGEFLAASEFGLQLAKSPRQQDHDTEGSNDKVQIKFHNSTKGTNIRLGNPDAYDRLIIVLGPDSCLRPLNATTGQYCLYEFSALHVKQHFESKSGLYSCAKKRSGLT